MVRAAAAEVGHVDAVFQPLDQARHDWQDCTREARDDKLRTVLGHYLVKSVEMVVAQAFAAAEPLQHLVFDGCGDTDELGRDSHVVRAGRTGQKGGMFWWQRVGPDLRIVGNDVRRHHDAEPLAQVTLGYVGLIGKRRRCKAGMCGQRIEQFGAMPERGHDRQRRFVQRADKAFGESLRLRVVECVGLILNVHIRLLDLGLDRPTERCDDHTNGLSRRFEVEAKGTVSVAIGRQGMN